jgi:glycine/D-amino acid oxidase-like deaminating enzyme
MKTGWFSALGRDVYEPALKKLDELVGVQDLQFKTTVGSVRVHWCDPRKILLDQNEVRTGQVTRFLKSERGWLVEFMSGSIRSEVLVPTVIAATGIWTNLFFPEVDVMGQAGVAWLWPKEKIAEPFIKVWAPYKQLVAFNRGDGLWMGDGSTARNWNDAYERNSLARCSNELRRRNEILGIVPDPVKLFGYRPYVKDAKPCFFKQVRPGFWVATGGAKNGTLAAGWCADQIVKALA